MQLDSLKGDGGHTHCYLNQWGRGSSSLVLHIHVRKVFLQEHQYTLPVHIPVIVLDSQCAIYVYKGGVEQS